MTVLKQSSGAWRATYHDEFTRCPGCGNATVGLARPYAINHEHGCHMDDDQIEARRAQIDVHCGGCGARFPGDTKLSNGLCRECCRSPVHLLRKVEALRLENEKLTTLAGRVLEAWTRWIDTRSVEWLNAPDDPDENALDEAVQALGRVAVPGRYI